MTMLVAATVRPLLRNVCLVFLAIVQFSTFAAAAALKESSESSKFSQKNHQVLRRMVTEDSSNDEEQQQEQQQQDVRHYELWKPEKFHETALEFADTYPNLIQVTTSQDKYGLPAAGGADDCPFWDRSGCPNYIMEIQDYIAHPPGSESSNRLPEVFWSGCLHGNERVGPTAVMEAVTLLLEAAACEALPQLINAAANTGNDNDNNSNNNVHAQQEHAKSCRQALEAKGIDTAHRKWLARLVSTRRIIVVPTANALGYYQNRRTEGMVDPNRDFPYDLQDPLLCMQTIAGRTLNEVYRDHMFQLALTFHAGMEVVGYEWGAPTWLDHWSPDDEAQSEIASAYSRYGGGWSTSKPYQYGTMNDLVYYVRGGMEDWAYAGSWDSERVIQCDPTSFGGYPKEKTTYDNSTLRVFNMLIETSDKKEPRKHDLGSSLDVLNRDTAENGHVSRNIRLALLAAELVEPYTSIVGVNNLALSDDIVPLAARGERTCQRTKAVMIAKNAEEAEIHWTVGGAMAIDNTALWYAKWDDIPEEDLDCLLQPTKTTYFQKGTIIGANNGTGTFSRAGPHPRLEPTDPITKETNGPIFTGKIPIPPGLNTLDELVVVVSARVDQGWKEQRSNTAPLKPPQSHVVNARTDPDWHHEKQDGKVIQGRLDWFSIPLTVVIGDFMDNVGTQGGHLVNTVERYPRFGDNAAGKGGMKPKSAGQSQLWFPVGFWESMAVLFLAVVVALGCCCVCQSRRRRTNNVVAGGGKNSDDFVFDSKPYSDSAQDENGEYSDESEGEVELPEMT